MTAEQFGFWLALMKFKGFARSDVDCARALGVNANALVRWKREGTDLRTALAASALLHEMKPFDLVRSDAKGSRRR